jgi:tRNA threonylcarbamoyladenosine biosynthesis protein TsaB
VFDNIDGIATLVGQEQVIAPERLTEQQFEQSHYLAVGTAWQSYPQMLALANVELLESVLYPDAKYMVSLALKQWQAGEAIDVEAAKPVYLRDTVTWKKLPGRE